ncbi:MAG: hypothetical protein PHV39_01925 [Methanomicrobium sp.]|nr:hypothetical protein [Methanomicrobium sp.]
MTRVSEITGQRFSLCRKLPVVRVSQTGGEIHKQAREEQSGGGGGGPGAVRRGVGAAILGMKTLNQNRQLLWFTLLAGVVLAANAIAHAAQYYLSWNLHLEIGIVEWRALEFFIEFATLFCLVFLLAGLFLSVSSKKSGLVSFFAGLFGAKKYLKEIILWSLILAAAGMLLNYVLFHYSFVFSNDFGFLAVFGYLQSFIFSTLSEFPFNLTLRWDLFTEIPGYGGRSVLFWIYPGLADALIYSAINLFLLVLTLFVLPLIVLKQKSFCDAVRGSFAVMKKTWSEAAVCIVSLGTVILGAFLIYIPVKAAFGVLAPLEVLYYSPSAAWIAIGFFYDLVFLSLVMVAATIGGIAAFDLYSSAESRRMPVSSETKHSE